MVGISVEAVEWAGKTTRKTVADASAMRGTTFASTILVHNDRLEFCY